MKKFFAVMFAVLFALSCMTVAFAAETEIVINGTEDKNLICDYCGKEFTSVEMLNAHLDATFAVKDHKVECENCFDVFTTKEALAAHAEYCTKTVACKYKANGCDWEGAKADYDAHCENCEYRSFCAMMKAGHVLEALKFAFNKVVDFVKSETFQNVAGKVVDVVKGIDFSSIIGKVKDIAGKIPFDTIVDTVKGLAQ